MHLVSVLYNVEISYGAKIGAFCCIDHANCIIIGQQARIGQNVMLMHGVTLGSTGEGMVSKSVRHPIVGGGVYMGAQSSVLGGTIIGHCVTIAASSVVLRNVLPWNVAVGMPARLLC